MRELRHIYRLGIKELINFRYDYILIVLVIYSFTVMVVSPSKGVGLQIHDVSIAFVDEDHSYLSERIREGIRKPYFREPVPISYQDIDLALDRGIYTFAVQIPSGFQRDVLAGKKAELSINIDATATGHAKLGTTYLVNMITDEITTYLYGDRKLPPPPVSINTRIKYNPNRENTWFMSLVFLTHMITLLSIILPAAALIKERERSTVEHLLVMPLKPFEITIAKVWSNSLIVVVGSLMSLIFVIKGYMGCPVYGSVFLFLIGTIVYLYATTELGIFLATIAKNQPQAGLLTMPIVTPMVMLSGGTTPIEAMPRFLQVIMQISPTTHYQEFISAVLIREAGIETVWPQLAAIIAIGTVLFIGAMMRFRKTFR